MHSLGTNNLIDCRIEQIMDDQRSRLSRFGRTNDLEVVAAIGNFNSQSTFNVAQIFIELPTKAGEPLVVIRLKGELQIVRMAWQVMLILCWKKWIATGCRWVR